MIKYHIRTVEKMHAWIWAIEALYAFIFSHIVKRTVDLFLSGAGFRSACIDSGKALVSLGRL
jgi:hypothetical protein